MRRVVNTSNINKQLPFHIKAEREHIIIDFYFAYGFHPSTDCYQGLQCWLWRKPLAVHIHPQIVTGFQFREGETYHLAVHIHPQIVTFHYRTFCAIGFLAVHIHPQIVTGI